MEVELVQFSIAFNQTALNKDGTADEEQWLILRALDGIGGRFYQIVLSNALGEERYWSFTNPEDVAKPLRQFIAWSEKIDDL